MSGLARLAFGVSTVVALVGCARGSAPGGTTPGAEQRQDQAEYTATFMRCMKRVGSASSVTVHDMTDDNDGMWKPSGFNSSELRREEKAKAVKSTCELAAAQALASSPSP